jgi:hypothetical protein
MSLTGQSCCGSGVLAARASASLLPDGELENRLVMRWRNDESPEDEADDDSGLDEQPATTMARIKTANAGLNARNA